MNPFELTILISTLASTISQILCDEELNLVGAIFTQLGDTLATVSAQRQFCNRCSSSNDKNAKSDSNETKPVNQDDDNIYKFVIKVE